jgi:hypothetical protein
VTHTATENHSRKLRLPVIMRDAWRARPARGPVPRHPEAQWFKRQRPLRRQAAWKCRLAANLMRAFRGRSFNQLATQVLRSADLTVSNDPAKAAMARMAHALLVGACLSSTKSASSVAQH